MKKTVRNLARQMIKSFFKEITETNCHSLRYHYYQRSTLTAKLMQSQQNNWNIVDMFKWDRLPLFAFSSRDITTVKITFGSKEAIRDTIISLIHLPYTLEELPPFTKLEEVTNFCMRQMEHFLAGLDLNSCYVGLGID